MIDFTRRLLLTHAPAAAAWSAFAAPAVGHASPDTQPLADGYLGFDNPADKFRALFRFERDLRDEGTALSTYQFLVYALPQGKRPLPILRFEGMEFSYFRRVGELTWRIHAHNLSYPRDLATGRFTSTVRNPFTGETLDVQPMRLLEDPGVLHSPRGYLPLDAKAIRWLDTYLVMRIEGDLVKSEHIRPTPDGWPTTFIESSVSSVPKRDFDNPKVTSLQYQTAGFYVFPFPAWMRMGDTPGHMLGAWSGRKIRDPRNLPREFLARARSEDAALLEPRWGEFDRPIAAALRGAY
ncbi:MAG: hypothetical protein R3E65_00385 [Steroidobacteraceae bacterium]